MEEASKHINIISFTEKGEALAKRLSTYLFQSQQKDQADCDDILEVRYGGKDVNDVLNMTVNEATSSLTSK